MMHITVNLMLFTLFFSSALAEKEYRLSGKHLWVLPYQVAPQLRVNDSTELRKNMLRPMWVQMDIVDWIAQRKNFTYSILATNETTIEAASNGRRGLASLLNEGSLDLAVGELIMLPSRFAYLDMSYPWRQTQAALLIPIPDTRANIAAILKPFDFKVWTCVVVSVILVSVIVMLINRWFIYHHENDHQPRISRMKLFSRLYAIEILLSQGGAVRSRIPSSIAMAGAWSLAAFVLSQAYTSTLITFVISPNQRPLINSINDLVANPHIRLLVERNAGFDVILSTSTEEIGIFKQIRERIKKFPESRCDLEAKCIELVRSGGPYVYLKTTSYILDIILKDYSNTKECRLQPAKEPFMNLYLSFGLAKRSPYSDHVRDGILELHSFGLIEHWVMSNRANPRRCLHAQTKKRSANPRLSLLNLTGAFVILISGSAASILLFCSECLAAIAPSRITFRTTKGYVFQNKHQLSRRASIL